MILWLLCLTIIAGVRATIWDTLTATIAVVEFHPSDNFTLAGISQDLLKYNDILSKLNKTTRFDMIVFPEHSISTTPKTSIKLHVGDNPCEGEGNYPQFFTNLSCAARKYNTYLVTNLIEKEKCANHFLRSENCGKFGYFFYNTAVVFDRNGKLLLRYRKYHLYGETNLDHPDKPEVVTFTTDFGVKFGLFICFDLLFKSPGYNLLSEPVDGIIFLSKWHSELPFFTSLQSQQMFAYAGNTTLFGAGGNNIETASGGTGIFRGANFTLGTVFQTSGDSHVLTYRSVNGEVKTIPPRPVDELSKEMDVVSLDEDPWLRHFQWKPVETKQHLQDQVCHGNFCCFFSMNITATNPTGVFYRYLMVAFSGVRKNLGAIPDTGLQVCAVLACLNSSITSCGRRFPNYESVGWPIRFDTLRIRADFEVNDEKIQWPNSLLSSIRPIDASETDWSQRRFRRNGIEMVERTFSLRRSQERVLTFGILGRDFKRDREKSPGRKRSANGISTKEDNGGGSLESTLVVLVASLCMIFVLKF